MCQSSVQAAGGGGKGAISTGPRAPTAAVVLQILFPNPLYHNGMGTWGNGGQLLDQLVAPESGNPRRRHPWACLLRGLDTFVPSDCVFRVCLALRVTKPGLGSGEWPFGLSGLQGKGGRCTPVLGVGSQASGYPKAGLVLPSGGGRPGDGSEGEQLIRPQPSLGAFGRVSFSPRSPSEDRSPPLCKGTASAGLGPFYRGANRGTPRQPAGAECGLCGLLWE